MECAFESPILYVQNKILILDISAFFDPWVHSEYREKL
jgi:hypothetical protein